MSCLILASRGLFAQLPENAEFIDQYTIGHEDEPVTVTILKRTGDTGHFYHIMPPEYTLSEEHHYLLTLGKGVLIEHQPKAEEFSDVERTRAVFLMWLEICLVSWHNPRILL